MTDGRYDEADPAGSGNYPLNCWYVVATSDEVGRSLLARQSLGRRLLLFRQENGQLAVLDDRWCAPRCTAVDGHARRGPGDMRLPRLHVCDGRQASVPSQRHVPYGAQVRCYPVRERPPFVWILARQSGAKPRDWSRSDPPALRESGWTIPGGSLEMAVNYMLWHDNALDRTHFPYRPPGTASTVVTSRIRPRWRSKSPRRPSRVQPHLQLGRRWGPTGQRKPPGCPPDR